MGLFDKFKKKDKEDKFDKQIAELQKKQQEMSPEQQEEMKKVADAYLAKVDAADIGETHKSGNVSASAARDAAKTFDSLAGMLGIKTNMSKVAAQQTEKVAVEQVEVEMPYIMEIQAATGYDKKNNYLYGVANDYSPICYCAETDKSYNPDWATLIDMILDTGLFDIDGQDSADVPEIMTTQVGNGQRDENSFIFGIAADYTPVIFCKELQKYVNFSWNDIYSHALDDGVNEYDDYVDEED